MKYNEIRRKTKKIKIGNSFIGGDSPIAIQSMTNTDTHNIDATVAQIKALENAKCDIVRITVPDLEAADIITELKKQVSIPVVAIGGIGADNVSKLESSGISGIAVISAIFAAVDIESATKSLKELTEKVVLK